MSALIKTDTRVTVVDKIIKYYKVDKYLGGLIKVKRLLYSDRVGQEIHISVPTQFKQYDNYYINGIKFVPEEQL